VSSFGGGNAKRSKFSVVSRQNRLRLPALPQKRRRAKIDPLFGESVCAPNGKKDATAGTPALRLDPPLSRRRPRRRCPSQIGAPFEFSRLSPPHLLAELDTKKRKKYFDKALQLFSKTLE
jgi:hypothetical protein